MLQTLFRRLLARRHPSITRRESNRTHLQLIELESRILPTDQPIARDDEYTIEEDTELVVPAPGILENDTPSGMEARVFEPGDISSQGTLTTYGTSGSFKFVPRKDFHGSARFRYQAAIGDNFSDWATVTITVTPVNDPPAAVDDTASTEEDTEVTINVLANDTDVESDRLTPSMVSGPINGTATVNADDTITYTPNANFNGTDSFTYKVNDGKDNSNVATVIITVNSVNDPPQANNDILSTDDRKPISGNVLDNDRDVDSASLVVSNPGTYTNDIGIIVLESNGKFTFTPRIGASGTFTLDYSINDDDGGTAQAQIIISVGIDVTPPSILEVRLHYGRERFVNILDSNFRGRILPWSNIRKVSLVFSEPVSMASNGPVSMVSDEPVPLSKGVLRVIGVNVSRYGFSNFSFDSSTNTATWVLDRRVGIDRLHLLIRSSKIQDLSNNILSVGNIYYGIRVHPGDFDGNGVVDDRDVRGVRQAIPASAPPLNKIFADINGDGSVTSQDIEEVKRRLGTRFGRIA